MYGIVKSLIMRTVSPGRVENQGAYKAGDGEHVDRAIISAFNDIFNDFQKGVKQIHKARC